MEQPRFKRRRLVAVHMPDNGGEPPAMAGMKREMWEDRGKNGLSVKSGDLSGRSGN